MERKADILSLSSGGILDLAHVRVALLFAIALLAGCTHKPETKHTAAAAGSIAGKLTVPAAAEDGQWLMAAKDYANTRFSALDQINAGNVSNLKLAWSFSTGSLKGHEGAPLVVGDTLYVITPFPNKLFALDLRNYGALKWAYDPKVTPSAQGVACCDAVNRGGAYWDGRIYYATLDNRVVAVDASTGKEAWVTKVGDINFGETITMAPIVVKGKVLVGNSGGEMGVRGWLKALDAGSGKVVWTAYNTGPDIDVLIGPNFQPYYASERGKDLGVSSWPPDKWKIGGAAVWGWVSYDPELDLIYYGTSNPSPWNPDQRPGDNKWAAGSFARRPESGEAIWFYQWSPHDLWDHDGVNEMILVDLDMNGQKRKVLIRPERTGYVMILDRTNGQVLSATPFVHITTSRGVDLKTGRLQIVAEKAVGTGRTVRDICPASPGGKDWNPAAFSPRTGLLYMGHKNLCQDEEGVEVGYIAGTPYVGANVRMYPGPGGHRGEFTAWDPIAAKPVFKIIESFPVWSGTLATAGDLAFYGTMEGFFKAVHARTGQVIWQTKLGSGIVGQPITFRSPDGKQYIAIYSGVGGWSGAIVSAGLDARDGTAALGFVNAMKDLPSKTTPGGMLYVFSLP
jgi:PQQ-dependent dehydrogenase (methanol/ethanol family)